jgi:hypothetical protein
MRVSNGSSTVEIRRFSQKSDLLRHLQGNDDFLLFESPEQEQEFYSIVIQPNFIGTKVGKRAIGICSEGQGISPELLPLPENHLLLVGFNDRVVGVNSESREVAFEHKLKSLFWSFAKIPSRSLILVFYEIGVKAITTDGQELWDYSRDLLTSAFTEGDALTLSFSDSPPTVLSLNTGQGITR